MNVTSVSNTPGRAYVILVNWNGWRDTIECLESLLRSDARDFQVVVCDNGSQDGSVQQIQAWARGERAVEGRYPKLVSPSLHEAARLTVYDRDVAEKGGDGDADDARVVLIDAGVNLGFAGGCNVAIRYALARGDCAYVWLLNNDTVVERGALRCAIGRLEADSATHMVGSLLLFYDEPEIVQALGGARFDPLTTSTTHIGALTPAATTYDDALVEHEMRYVVGAALLTTRNFIESVGLLDEGYFLYFEELDWTLRAARRFGRVGLGFARDSVVYHKEGRSIGSDSEAAAKSPLADYYLLRNRIRVIRRFFPRFLPLAYAGLVVAAVNRMRRRQWRRLELVARAALAMGEPGWLRSRR